ncbi:MAG: allantoinase, partial [Brevibacterium sp.]|nr:allantoinase [Brevibacterium sp.]
MNVDDAGTPATDQEFDLVIRAQRAVLPGGQSAAEVGVRGGRIVEIATGDTVLSGTTSANAKVVELDASQVLLPGLVASPVHVNDPGRSEWEGFASATRAAAAGGVTTIVDMPLNSLPPTVNVESLDIKREVAGPKAFIDVGFWGGAIPGNTGDLRP